MPLPPVQPQQALLTLAGHPVRPGPSGAVTKLASQAGGSLISLLLPSKEHSASSDQMSVLVPETQSRE